MAILDLIGKQASEKCLHDELVFEVRSNYESYKTKCYFIKLERVSPIVSKVVWVKEFENERALEDFYYASVFYRACIQLKFCRDHYKVLWEGFQRTNSFRIHVDGIDKERLQAVTYNIEKHRMIPKDIMEQGIRELQVMFLESSSGSESK